MAKEKGLSERREAGFLISRIHRLSQSIISRKMRKYGLEISPAQARIMYVLWRKESIPISELGGITSLKKSTMTSMLDRLERTGFLTRTGSKEDRRKILIQRTDKDGAWQKEYVSISTEMEDSVFKGFSEEEKDQFEWYLKRVLENLVSSEETPAKQEKRRGS